MHPALTPGSVAVITGAASGMGLETARLFAGQGWFVGAVDVNTAGLDALKAELGDLLARGEAFTVRVDLPGDGPWAVSFMPVIDVSASNAGYLDIRMQPERKNRIKVVMLLDVGGTVDFWEQRRSLLPAGLATGFPFALPSGDGLWLLGLLGLSVGLEEGLELNVLGLNFGVDLNSPALRLPAITDEQRTSIESLGEPLAGKKLQPCE